MEKNTAVEADLTQLWAQSIKKANFIEKNYEVVNNSKIFSKFLTLELF